jgi:hypothetical protein
MADPPLGMLIGLLGDRSPGEMELFEVPSVAKWYSEFYCDVPNHNRANRGLIDDSTIKHGCAKHPHFCQSYFTFCNNDFSSVVGAKLVPTIEC